MIDRELIAFVVEAKKNTYAAEEANETILPNGGRKLIYEAGLYIYEDIYYGFNEFYGRETAFKRGAPHPRVWIMQYSGFIPPEVCHLVDPAKVYSSLKMALREVSFGMPFRGPRTFDTRDFSYFCDVEGNPNFFFGHESLRGTVRTSGEPRPGVLAYIGAFHGLIQE